MFSKRRWERIHNLLAASSALLAKKVQTVTFTMDELELRTYEYFAVVPNEPKGAYLSARPREIHEIHQLEYMKTNVAQEDAALAQYGVVDIKLMLDVMRLIKLHDCWIRLELSPSEPWTGKRSPINRRAREVHSDLQRAIAQVRPKINTLSIDRLRHRDMVEVLAGCDAKVFDSYTSLAQIRLTPCKKDGLTGFKNKHCTCEVLEAIFKKAQQLRSLHIHKPFAYRKEGYLLWAPNLLRYTRLSKLVSLSLVDVPLSQDHLLNLLRRCAGTLNYLKLFPEAPDTREVRISVLKQLVTMKLVYVDLKFYGMRRCEYLRRRETIDGLSLLLRTETGSE